MGGFFDRIKKLFSGTDLLEADKVDQIDRTIAQRQIAEIMAKEEAYVGSDRAWGEEILTGIDFEVVASDDEREDFEDGIVPWINVAERSNEIGRLIDADEIVLLYPRVNIVFDYPINNPTTREISTENEGFSRRELIELIGKYYEEIYDEEEASANVKTLSMDERKIMNRNQTDGIYGIWGHDLADIAISGVEVRRSENGKIFLLLGIES